MTEEFCLLHCWKSVVENSNSYSGCGWVAVPIHGRSCPVSSPPFLAVHPHAPQGRWSAPLSPGLPWEVLLWGFSDLFQSSWSKLNHFHCQSCWSSLLGLKYRSLHQQIQGTHPGRREECATGTCYFRLIAPTASPGPAGSGWRCMAVA